MATTNDGLVQRTTIAIAMTIAAPVLTSTGMDEEQIASIDRQGVSPYRAVIETFASTIEPGTVDEGPTFASRIMNDIDIGEAHDVTPIWTDGVHVACIVFFPHPDA